MGDITSRIRLFHNLYMACLSGTVIFAGITAAMYLYLDIKTAVRVLAGIKRTYRPKRQKRFLAEKTDSFKQVAEIPDSQEQTVELSVETVRQPYGKTDLMQPNIRTFFVEQEILVVHTDITVSDELPV